MMMITVGTSGTVPGTITVSGLMTNPTIGDGAAVIGTILPTAIIIIGITRLSTMTTFVEDAAMDMRCTVSAVPQTAICNEVVAVDMADTVAVDTRSNG